MRVRWSIPLLIAVALTGCSQAPPIDPCAEPDRAVARTAALDEGTLHTLLQQPVGTRPVNLVFLPEGFTASELDTFRAKVDRLLAEMGSDPRGIVGGHPALFNAFRVDLSSPSNQVTNAARGDTLFGGCFVRDVPEFSDDWILHADQILTAEVARRYVPAVDVAILLLNARTGRANADQGWADFPTATGTILLNLEDSGQVLNHELGHALIGLGDEYVEAKSCFLDAPGSLDHWWSEALEPNLTLDPTCAKWSSLSQTCREGGARFSTCVYHPTDSCTMSSSDAFCPVCRDAIEKALAARSSGANDGPPRLSLGMPEAPGSIHRSFALSIRIADRDFIDTISVYLDDQSLVTTLVFDPQGHASFVPDVLRGYEGCWLFQGSVDVDVSRLQSGTHRLTVQAVDARGASTTQAVDLQVQPP